MVVRRCLRGAASAATTIVAAALVFAPPMRAYDAPRDLNSVAHVYSLGVGEVRCASQPEWDGDGFRAFPAGYTNVRKDYSVLAPIVCDGALNVGTTIVPLWQQAYGVLVLVHEAFHLRHWRFRRNEGKVSCQAIVNFTDAAKLLGADDEQANELYPYALALHVRQTHLYSWYRDPKCQVPFWTLPQASKQEGGR